MSKQDFSEFEQHGFAARARLGVFAEKYTIMGWEMARNSQSWICCVALLSCLSYWEGWAL
jgi:hypothetical protein